MAKSKFDIDSLHEAAMKRHRARKSEDGPHSTYDVNVKESYKQSLALIEAADIDEDEKELRIAHLENAISAGECHYA